MMPNRVDFTSSLFVPFLSEEAQVNPRCYGAELSWWLCRELAAQGIETSYPISEDWGWFLEYQSDDNCYWLCCRNIEGKDTRWCLYLQPRGKGWFGRTTAPIKLAQPLLTTLAEILQQAEEISEIIWSQEDA